MAKQYTQIAADFETTVYDGQELTQAWACAFSPLHDGMENVTIIGNIKDFLWNFFNARKNFKIYFHNLKFDGSFIIDFLLKNGFKQGLTGKGEERRFKKDQYLHHREIKYMISDKGLWYGLTICWRGCLIKFLDSYKLLPHSLDSLAKSFRTKRQKLTMEYEGVRYENCPISDEERKYIENDVLILKELLEIFFGMGHSKSTIASCCMADYKSKYDKHIWNAMFPNIYEDTISEELYGYKNAGEYVHKSYKGGWCYVKKGISGKVISGGHTLDVNSLYPSVMHSKSGNRYPVGHATFFSGDIPECARSSDIMYFVRIRTAFRIRDNYLPFVQIKNSLMYKGNEMLETSDIKLKDGTYLRYGKDGKRITVELTFSKMDYELFLKHYDCEILEVLDGCYFNTEIGLFDEYIDKHYNVKQNSKGAKRSVAKLFLNGLYGRFAMYTDSSFKIASVKDEVVQYESITANEKKPGYIPIGSCVTSYARCFEITHAQLNYERFLYADTDSIHLSGEVELDKGVMIDDKELLCWKNEGYWKEGIFLRQKAYIELHGEIMKKDDIKCAGMNDRCKNQIAHAYNIRNGYEERSIEDIAREEGYNELQKNFINQGFDLTDFRLGMEVFGNLKAKRINGGTILIEDWYKLRLTARRI